jgi:hypothetical protein
MALPCAINSQWSHVAERRPVAAAGYDSCCGFTGSASLTIDLDGFPGGETRAASRTDGLFKQVTLNRRRPMAPASETSWKLAPITVILRGALLLNLFTPRTDRIKPGDFEGSAPKPAPPSDHIPLGGVVRFRTLSTLLYISPGTKSRLPRDLFGQDDCMSESDARQDQVPVGERMGGSRYPKPPDTTMINALSQKLPCLSYGVQSSTVTVIDRGHPASCRAVQRGRDLTRLCSS